MQRDSAVAVQPCLLVELRFDKAGFTLEPAQYYYANGVSQCKDCISNC